VEMNSLVASGVNGQPAGGNGPDQPWLPRVDFTWTSTVGVAARAGDRSTRVRSTANSGMSDSRYKVARVACPLTILLGRREQQYTVPMAT